MANKFFKSNFNFGVSLGPIQSEIEKNNNQQHAAPASTSSQSNYPESYLDNADWRLSHNSNRQAIRNLREAQSYGLLPSREVGADTSYNSSTNSISESKTNQWISRSRTLTDNAKLKSIGSKFQPFSKTTPINQSEDALLSEQIDITSRIISLFNKPDYQDFKHVQSQFALNIHKLNSKDLAISLGRSTNNYPSGNNSQFDRTPATIVFTSEDGSSDIVSTAHTSPTQITTTISDSRSDNVLLEINYALTAQGTLTINAPEHLVELDSSTSFNDLNIGAWTTLAAIRRLSKTVALQSKKDNDTRLLGGMEKPEFMCIPHDLVCSALGPLTVYVWVPCIGTFKVDNTECCIKHDTAYWCAVTPLEKILADARVVGCISDNMMNFMNKFNVPWYCGGNVSRSTASLIQAAIFAALAMATLTFIWPGGGRVGGGIVPGDADRTSCLCGGNVPTYQCNTDPSDSRNWKCLDPYCTTCEWRWNVDGTGKKINCFLWKDRQLPCCPGSPKELPSDINIADCIRPTEAVRRR